MRMVGATCSGRFLRHAGVTLPHERRTQKNKAFNAIVDVYETWRDKALSRKERSAALGALSNFIHEMGWTKAVQDELEQRSRGRR